MLYLNWADVFVNPVTIFIAGLLAGVAGGVFGSLTNLVIIPALSILGLPIFTSTGSGTGLFFARSSLSIFSGRHSDLPFKRVGVLAGVLGLPWVFAGFWFNTMIMEKTWGPSIMLLCYTATLLAGSVIVFRKWSYFNRNDYYDDAPFPTCGLNWRFPLAIPGGCGLIRITLARTCVVGTLLGIVTGFLGLGAGLLGIPLFMYILGLPRDNAVATDTITMTVLGAGAFTFYAASGRMEFVIVLLLILSVTLGFHIGSALPGELNHSHARLALSAILAVVALALPIKFFNSDLALVVASAAGITLCCFLLVYSVISERAWTDAKEAIRGKKTL